MGPDSTGLRTMTITAKLIASLQQPAVQQTGGVRSLSNENGPKEEITVERQ